MDNSKEQPMEKVKNKNLSEDVRISDQHIESAGYSDCGDRTNHNYKSSDQIEPWIEGAKWMRDKIFNLLKP